MSVTPTPEERIIAAAAAMLGRKGGLAKSAAKTKSGRENGKKGGRPPQDPNTPAPSKMAEYQRRHRARVKAAKAKKTAK
jgi:hypothetical protein